MIHNKRSLLCTLRSPRSPAATLLPKLRYTTRPGGSRPHLRHHPGLCCSAMSNPRLRFRILRGTDVSRTIPKPRERERERERIHSKETSGCLGDGAFLAQVSRILVPTFTLPLSARPSRLHSHSDGEFFPFPYLALDGFYKGGRTEILLARLLLWFFITLSPVTLIISYIGQQPSVQIVRNTNT